MVGKAISYLVGDIVVVKSVVAVLFCALREFCRRPVGGRLLSKFKRFYQQHAKVFSTFFTLVVVVIWLLGPVFLDLLDLAQAMALSIAIVLVMLGLVQDVLNDLVGVDRLGVDGSQSESNRHVMRVLINKKIERVHMIEYDGESVKPLIFFFLEKGAQVHCLLQHPDSTVNESQRRRSIFQIVTRHEEYLGYEDQIIFSYYRDTASVRGRLVDDSLLSLGWYSYDRRPGIPGRQIWGHNNPVILIEPSVPEGQVLSRFFEGVFANLLANSETSEELSSRYELLIRTRIGSDNLASMRFDIDIDALGCGDQLPADVSGTVVESSQLGEVSPAQLLPMITAGFEDREWTEELLRERVLSRDTCRAAILARSTLDDTLIGFVSLHATADPSTVKLHWLVVQPDHRRRGIGRYLVKQAGRVAARGGFSTMMLRTESHRTAAIALYRGLGFRATSQTESVA